MASPYSTSALPGQQQHPYTACELWSEITQQYCHLWLIVRKKCVKEYNLKIIVETSAHREAHSHTRTHTHTHAHTLTHTHALTHTHTHSHVHAHARTYTYIYAHPQTHTNSHTGPLSVYLDQTSVV